MPELACSIDELLCEVLVCVPISTLDPAILTLPLGATMLLACCVYAPPALSVMLLSITDLMVGQIDYAIESSSTVEGSCSTGKTRRIGVMRDKRVAILPDVRATGETKYTVNFDIWNMILVPKGVPQPVL